MLTFQHDAKAFQRAFFFVFKNRNWSYYFHIAIIAEALGYELSSTHNNIFFLYIFRFRRISNF